jgi:hypothetical protein
VKDFQQGANDNGSCGNVMMSCGGFRSKSCLATNLGKEEMSMETNEWDE